ncbi:MAG: hypothetical protein OEN23_13605 [Paracoccaceae bacterium]|nr:hypothetical protein [Paracoccaceae bacterium]
MTDVMKIAKNHRDRLKAEISKIDEFIAMAEELAQRVGGDTASAKQAAVASKEDPPIELARRSSNGAAAN